MSPIIVVTAVSAAVVVMVLIGSLYVISKGYGYKQEIDPLPEEEEIEKEDRKENME